MRSIFFDRPNPEALPLGFPADSAARATVPDDWTVWAAGDLHGCLDAFRRALGDAGLTDADGHWCGGSRTALVGVGDYVDRGADTAGLVDYLSGLETEMVDAGSRMVLVRGNHEQMLADILRGSDEWFESWRDHGGRESGRSYGIPNLGRPFAHARASLLAAAPGLADWLLATLPYAVWRDVLFVHAAPPPDLGLAELCDNDRQLWETEPFVVSGGLGYDPMFALYRDAGIARVVVGHMPQMSGPAVDHEGCLLLLDTNAGSADPAALALVTLARIPDAGDLGRSDFVMAAT